ncbi:hypothetical protein HEP_00503900, partial [Hepatocystis sp. ex Piliocolobus tephrosceles]
MDNSYNINTTVQLANTLKQKIIDLSDILKSRLGVFCENTDILQVYDESYIISNKLYNSLYNSWRVEDLNNFSINSIFNILKRNSYVNVYVTLLIFLTIFYFFFFICYTKCFKKLIKKIYAFFDKKNKNHEEDENLLTDTSKIVGVNESDQSIDKAENGMARHTSYDINKYKNYITVLKNNKWFNIFFYLLLLSLVTTFTLFYSKTINRFAVVNNGVKSSFCRVYKISEKYISENCSETVNMHNEPCLSAYSIVDDATKIFHKYESIKTILKDMGLLSNEQIIPFFK